MKTKLTAVALSLGVLAGGVVAPAYADDAKAGSIAEQTRQDLADWRQAGFDEASAYALSQDVFSDAYRDRMAKYQELRQQRGK
ncbi:hypothetical protein PuT2_13670 [Pusillimonas sp. T2]|nr:hypothetical protein PuT2_13670 [Pusillimonas sp. T2]